MKRLTGILDIVFAALALMVMAALLLCWASAAVSQPLTTIDGGFLIHVIDRDVDTNFELVTADTGFTPMSTDTTVMIAFDTTGYAGASSADTAEVYVVGVRHNAQGDSLRRIQRLVRVAGGDTVQVNSGDTLSIYETAWVDSSVAGPIMVFSDAASPRASLLDTIAANTTWSPKAHVFFGRGDRGRITHVDAQSMSGVKVTCEFRVWSGVSRDVNYAGNGYVVAAAADSTTLSLGGHFSRDFPDGGLDMAEESYAAWLCKGAAANADVAVSIVGRRDR